MTVPEKYTLKNISTPTASTSEEQYDRYVDVLMNLDKKGHLNRQEESYAKILSAFIKEWDDEHHPIEDASPVEVLRTLMEANGLRQKDLVPIFGTESIVSEVLNEKRALTVDHIIRLSQRFNVLPAVFIAERKIVTPKRNVTKARTAHAHYGKRSAEFK